MGGNGRSQRQTAGKRRRRSILTGLQHEKITAEEELEEWEVLLW